MADVMAASASASASATANSDVGGGTRSVSRPSANNLFLVSGLQNIRLLNSLMCVCLT